MDPAPNLLFNQVKAGLGYIDKESISNKIKEVSKDTKYYQKQKERSKIIDNQIDELKLKLKFAKRSELALAQAQVDSYIHSIEKKRSQDQIIFHADLDAFFASVEVINDPTLAGIPFAVGGSIKHGVISTSSYEARQYGVRSGMAVFIALSLCPNLRIVSHSGRYGEFSELVQSEFAFYDPNYTSYGLDEAAMNMTEYLSKTGQSPVEVAKEIQEKVFKKTKLTLSIGIGPTNQLAKIASDVNKPNGVFEIPTDLNEMLNFIRSLPVRKIPGVGGVTERKLQELNFNVMGDILDRRAEIWYLFSKSFCSFIFSSALGIQYSISSHDEQKSYSKEETFDPTDDIDFLMDKVEKMSEKLALKLQRNSMRCKTVTVKFKTHDFQILSHAYTFKRESSTIADVTNAAVKILMNEHFTKRLKLRLIGVRVSNLLYPGQKRQVSLKDWLQTCPKTPNTIQMNPSETPIVDFSENPDEKCDQRDIENHEEEEEENGYSIKRYFKPRSDFSDDGPEFEQSSIQTEAEKKEEEEEESSYSIKRYFKPGPPFKPPTEPDNSNGNGKIESEISEDESGYSIKRYFKPGEPFTNDYEIENRKEARPSINNADKKKGSPILKYFEPGNNDAEVNKHYFLKKKEMKSQVKKDAKAKDSIDFPLKKYFGQQSIEEEEIKVDQNKFAKKCRYPKHRAIFDFSDSDYDELNEQPCDEFFASQKQPQHEMNKRIPKNQMMKVIKKFIPEKNWKTELKKLNQPPIIS